MNRYKARPGKLQVVGLHRVTDDPAGVELKASPTVREHVRLGRLLLVEAKHTNEATTKATAKSSDEANPTIATTAKSSDEPIEPIPEAIPAISTPAKSSDDSATEQPHPQRAEGDE